MYAMYLLMYLLYNITRHFEFTQHIDVHIVVVSVKIRNQLKKKFFLDGCGGSMIVDPKL